MRENRKKTSIFPGLVFAALVSALLCARSAAAQAPETAAFILRAAALDARLTAWQQTLNGMTFGEWSPPNLSLSDKRGMCVEWIHTTRGRISRLEEKPTLGTQFLLLSSLTFLDNALLNLADALKLARTIQPPSSEPTILKQNQEKVASIRTEFHGFYTELSSTTFQQLHAVDEVSGKRHVLQQPGGISGHIYRADTGKPLADVVVTLESPKSPRSEAVKRTASEGSFGFDQLSPGYYWVIAYRSGFVGSVYGLDGSQNVSKGLISVAPGQSVDDIDFRIRPVPDITSVNGESLATAFRGLELGLVYDPGTFSPDGSQFAFAVTGAGEEQVCLYNITSRSLKCASGPWEQGMPGSTAINYLAWVGDMLHAETSYLGGGVGHIFQVTPGGTQPLTVVQQAFRREHNHAGGAGVIHLTGGNIHFTVTAWYGQLAMQTTDGDSPYQIASGGKELYSFIFDPDRSLVFYPVPGHYSGAIVAFDLNTRKSQKVALPFSEGLKLLDAIREPNGTIVAYVVDGTCTPKESPSGEDPWILPNLASPTQLPSHVCLVKLPAKANE